VYLLDADLNQAWRFPVEEAQESPPAPLFPGSWGDGAGGGPDLQEGVDILASREGLLALYTDGALRRHDGGDRHPTLDEAVDAQLPLGLLAHGGRFYVVDGLRQALIAVDAERIGSATGYQFVFPGMGLLRDVAIDGEGRLLALADSALFVYPTSGASGTCDAPPDSLPPLFYYGVDLASALAGFRYPIDGAFLPSVPRAYPGARRLYRAGVHRGLDIHPWDVPGGIDIGEPVRAMQDGIVTRADVDYQPVGNAEFNILTGQALALGFSPPGMLDRIGGRQVHIDHGDGISTRYLHLDSLADGIAPGAAVRRGEVIGTVGISGTGREADEVFVAAHAHVEIWIWDSYLGQGLTLRETMWLWQQVFPTVAVAPLVDE
jgi:murein DD-endopeptidase MepM/ murein hydrolase activator NlpD